MEKLDQPQAYSLPQEMDAAAIVRPERIISPDVAAITVNVTVPRDNQPQELKGAWYQYQQWRNGERAMRELTRMLVLPDSRTMTVHPFPSSPRPGERCPWSRESRAEWLNGQTPTAHDVLNALMECFEHFLYFDESAREKRATLALWAMLTYGYHAWETVPYLHITGPLGTGKTRVLQLLEKVVFRPLLTSGTTGPCLFRTLHERGGTVLYDEAETLHDAHDVRSMLLAGTKQDGRASRLDRSADGDFRPTEYSVFGPKAVACIQGLPPALHSRCVPLTMSRCPKGVPHSKRRLTSFSDWQRIRDLAYSWAVGLGGRWLELAEREDVCPDLSGRDFEVWQPLLAIASEAKSEGGCDLLEPMKRFSVALTESNAELRVPELDEVLLCALVKLLQTGEAPTCIEVLAAASEERREVVKEIKPRGVSCVLRRYGLVPDQKHRWNATPDALRKIELAHGIDLGREELLPAPSAN